MQESESGMWKEGSSREYRSKCCGYPECHYAAWSLAGAGCVPRDLSGCSSSRVQPSDLPSNDTKLDFRYCVWGVTDSLSEGNSHEKLTGRSALCKLHVHPHGVHPAFFQPTC
eukprot:5639981-Amphidinium_carterae.1